MAAGLFHGYLHLEAIRSPVRRAAMAYSSGLLDGAVIALGQCAPLSFLLLKPEIYL